MHSATKFIDGHPESHIALARKHGENWYIGVLNNSESKTINLNLDFLDKDKKYIATIYADAKDAH